MSLKNFLKQEKIQNAICIGLIPASAELIRNEIFPTVWNNIEFIGKPFYNSTSILIQKFPLSNNIIKANLLKAATIAPVIGVGVLIAAYIGYNTEKVEHKSTKSKIYNSVSTAVMIFFSSIAGIAGSTISTAVVGSTLPFAATAIIGYGASIVSGAVGSRAVSYFAETIKSQYNDKKIEQQDRPQQATI